MNPLQTSDTNFLPLLKAQRRHTFVGIIVLSTGCVIFIAVYYALVTQLGSWWPYFVIIFFVLIIGILVARLVKLTQQLRFYEGSQRGQEPELMVVSVTGNEAAPPAYLAPEIYPPAYDDALRRPSQLTIVPPPSPSPSPSLGPVIGENQRIDSRPQPVEEENVIGPDYFNELLFSMRVAEDLESVKEDTLEKFLQGSPKPLNCAQTRAILKQFGTVHSKKRFVKDMYALTEDQENFVMAVINPVFDSEFDRNSVREQLGL